MGLTTSDDARIYTKGRDRVPTSLREECDSEKSLRKKISNIIHLYI